ncbi:MAG: fumarylacetoacetate hydrolase family protein [Arenicellales bacterium]|jgi:2-keto-4-pentenoate hydratase/2-oxohepta-3-ene-1,7-dioic acid hydratase in catechol pathway|nr:5-carboxymethyl-2-hydroxymuconate isomerase [Acidiferrobacteraceae bacterium]MDP6137016.1 fumarylacetoacetate hydrolase family protein [Arenicellales bacterium]MDP6392501.1 fumarylacetoacetate hydrolase family protein [Arenicellales bacterium]MDP7220202.1 fumarylacetoacetate hydrolase family protein [Arenicellales bacterium]HJP11810.1 fumarylacetoacetate hydrolase family protein [Arenicellales bacterium]|tara:strand:- start:2682 stop:3530 length:849 start_codon:yes stop_codon:yes gene_type:complete
MKLTSFTRNNASGYGAVTDDGIVDLSSSIEGVSDLKTLLETGRLAEAADYAGSRSADFPLDEVTFLPLIPNASKVICVAVNYLAHAREAGRTIGDYPVLFHRHAQTQVGHQQPLLVPKSSEQLDFEGEIAVVLGKGGAHIEPENALDHVAGYACYNEGSVRDWQFHVHQYSMGKNFNATGGFGPWLVTTDDIPDPDALTVTTRLNGEQMQFGQFNDVAFNIPTLISYVSRALPWCAGDVIVTGTPGGVGFKRQPPIFLKEGDVVEVEVNLVGTLVNTVANEI